MTRVLSILLFCTIPLLAASQTPIADQIRYEDSSSLSWEDFTKRIRPRAVYKAFTYAGISFSIATTNGIIQIEVYSYFDKMESWVEKDHQKPELLNHEQRHFDITELWARRIKKELAKWDGMNVRTFLNKGGDEKTQEIYDYYYAKMEEEQIRYDTDTDHGTIDEKQVKWDLDIEARLDLR